MSLMTINTAPHYYCYYYKNIIIIVTH